jgi:hypothetical protein
MIKEKDIATKEEAKAIFESYHSEDLWDQLLGHTYHMFDRRYSVPEKGEELRDRCRGVIIDAIERVIITGVRKWDKNHYPDFKIFLFGVIDSIIIDNFRKPKTNYEDIEIPNDQHSGIGTDDILNGKELLKICSNLLKDLNASEDEMNVFECITEGMKMPGEVRDFLEIDPKEFHNLSRSFSRKWGKVLIKLKEHGY